MSRPRADRRRAPRLCALLAAALAALAFLVAAGPARAAFTPPPLDGHVVDTAGKLNQEEVLDLDGKLDAIQRQTGFEIVAFVIGSLEGETIDDVAYEAFNAWGIGRKGLDNGVLLVIAPNERRVRIETGKGVGGALTDLQSNDIIRQRINPLLRQGRFHAAIDQGTQAIAQTLVGGTPPSPPGEAQPPPRKAPSPLNVGISAGVLLLVIVLSIISPGFRAFLWFLLWSGRGGGGGGGGGGGSGYGGGGGRSGGGGSSDSY